MGEASESDRLQTEISKFSSGLTTVLLPQRPYDIHASNSVESLIQLFSTVSVHYSPSWPKELVSLLRKVRWTSGKAESSLTTNTCHR